MKYPWKFNPTEKKVFLSPSDLSTFEWSPEDFFKRYVLGEYEDPGPLAHWGTLCHAIVQKMVEGETEFPFPIDGVQNLLMQDIAEEMAGFSMEVSLKNSLMVDDWEVIMSYRLDGFKSESDEVIELKFPKTPWTQGKANSDTKTLCYKLFHENVKIVCLPMKSTDFDIFECKTGREKAMGKVSDVIRQIIGRLSLNYF